jgi:hypothetical protein
MCAPMSPPFGKAPHECAYALHTCVWCLQLSAMGCVLLARGGASSTYPPPATVFFICALAAATI